MVGRMARAIANSPRLYSGFEAGRLTGKTILARTRSVVLLPMADIMFVAAIVTYYAIRLYYLETEIRFKAM
ncbi:hypothetical protein BGC30_10260 [Novacetimonas hansenii]|nr:hypothetical protein BGC30_10260 [Novacetimonas hansenii]